MHPPWLFSVTPLLSPIKITWTEFPIEWRMSLRSKIDCNSKDSYTFSAFSIFLLFITLPISSARFRPWKWKQTLKESLWATQKLEAKLNDKKLLTAWTSDFIKYWSNAYFIVSGCMLFMLIAILRTIPIVSHLLHLFPFACQLIVTEYISLIHRKCL